MKKNTSRALIITGAIVLVVVVGAVIRYNAPSLNPKLLVAMATAKQQTQAPFVADTNAWQPYMVIAPEDTTHVFRVVWAQKYGEFKTEYCKLVFRNDKEKQYKLIAPWLPGVDIERQNMDDIKFEKISIDSMPTGTAVVK
jgi:hypothetical protein